MDRSVVKRNRVLIVLILSIVACLLFFVYSLFSAKQRSNQVEESQLRLIVNNLQLENRIVFTNIEMGLKLEAKKMESGGHEISDRNAIFSMLKNLIDVSDKVAVIGILSEEGEEYAIQKRNNLYATYYYPSAADSLASVVQWDTHEKRVVPDTLVGNRLFNADIFRIHTSQAPGKIIWRSTANLPGYAGRKGLSASTLVTNAVTRKKYIIVFFMPFKRLMTNTIKVGFKKGDVFMFRKDSLFFNFDGTSDTAGGFDTNRYFIPWKDIQDQKQLAALKTWQTLDNQDSIRFARFTSDGVDYFAAFGPIAIGPVTTDSEGAYYALVIPSEKLVTLFHSKTGVLVFGAFMLLLLSAIIFTFMYVKNFRKVRFTPLTIDMVRQMIAVGESDLLEFKSTIRTNLHAGKPGKEIELAWLKSVVAFCNTEGGTILIGVKDNGEIVGLEADNFQSDDKCLLHVQNLISEHVGLEYLPYVRFTLLQMDDKKVLAIQCIQLKRIMLLKSAGKEQFYVRSGPSSIELPVSKVLEYVNDRKKRF